MKTTALPQNTQQIGVPARIRAMVGTLLALALVFGLGGTAALAFAAFVYPAQKLNVVVITVLAFLVLAALCAIATSLLFVRLDSAPPSSLGPVTATLILLVTLPCWALATSIPANGLTLVGRCLDQRHLCFVRYGNSGRDLAIATVCWALAFVLSLAAFTRLNWGRHVRH